MIPLQTALVSYVGGWPVWAWGWGQWIMGRGLGCYHSHCRRCRQARGQRPVRRSLPGMTANACQAVGRYGRPAMFMAPQWLRAAGLLSEHKAQLPPANYPQVFIIQRSPATSVPPPLLPCRRPAGQDGPVHGRARAHCRGGHRGRLMAAEGGGAGRTSTACSCCSMYRCVQLLS